MWRPRWFSRTFLRVLGFAAIAPLAGCAWAPDGEYRFQAAMENVPVAYRGVRGGEPLRITVNFQNFSEKYIPVADNDGRARGLYLKVSASSASGLTGRPAVHVGLRSGSMLLPARESASPLWFDSHNPAVRDLAATGPVLLHLDGDTIQNVLTLLSNEAAFTVEVPIDWRRVPSGGPGTKDYSVPILVTVKIDFAYVDHTGKQYAFTKGVSRAVAAVLINDLRPGSGFRPANGPVSGVFREQ